MQNKLILRDTSSPFTGPYIDINQGSVLSHEQLDGNFIYLKGETIYTASTTSNILNLGKLNGENIAIDLAFSGSSQDLQSVLDLGSFASILSKTLEIEAQGISFNGTLGVSLNSGNTSISAAPDKADIYGDRVVLQSIVDPIEINTINFNTDGSIVSQNDYSDFAITEDNAIPTTLAVKKLIVKNEIRNKPYYYPDWYTGVRIPVNIKNGEARYIYDVADNIILSNYIPYFISPTGNDANDGLTELTPKKSIAASLTAGAKLIYLMPGIYLRDTMYTSSTNLAGNDLILIGIGEVNITNGQGGLAWVLSTNNTYRATRSNVSNVVDFKFKNRYGFYSALKKVTSQALCEAESGTYFTDNVGVWVHTQDNRVPDSNLLPTLVASNVLTTNVGKIYHENLNFYDIELYITGNINTSTLEIYMKNVNVPLTKQGTGVLEFNNYRFGDFKTAIMQDCVGIESTQDIFNYHNVAGVPNSCVVELDCSAYGAGLNIAATNNQCSSVHEAIKILRLNGNYYGGNAQVIADVGVDTQTIMVGCELNTGTEQPNTVIFFGVNADLEACKLIGDKIIAAENTSVEGVNIRNSMLEYSSLVGNVNISQ